MGGSDTLKLGHRTLATEGDRPARKGREARGGDIAARWSLPSKKFQVPGSRFQVRAGRRDAPPYFAGHSASPIPLFVFFFDLSWQNSRSPSAVKLSFRLCVLPFLRVRNRLPFAHVAATGLGGT